MIELTKGQEEGAKKTVEWFNSPTRKQVWQISGYAGSGKTSMVYYVIERLGLSQNEVAFATYTGKAALVLTLKGCPATTIHKLIYEPYMKEVPLLDKDGNAIEDENGNTCVKSEVRFNKKKELDDNLKLIVIDECSMIDEKMFNDLKSFDLPIIVLGDKGQLPPIYGNSPLLKEGEIDVTLTEIMRQKEGDPIIYLATQARLGKPLTEGKYGISYVFNRTELDKDLKYGSDTYSKVLSNADIVLCRTNKSRNKLNKHIRENIYDIHKKMPTLNDKLICRRNNWELSIDEEYDINLVNGLIGYVNSPVTNENMDVNHSYFSLDFKPEMCMEDFFSSIPCSMIPFLDLNEEEKKMFEYKQWRYFKNKKMNCNIFEFAYAITVHLSQGSQWKRTLIYDENYGSKDEYNKSLYTAITRAEKQIIIAKDVKSSNYYGKWSWYKR